MVTSDGCMAASDGCMVTSGGCMVTSEWYYRDDPVTPTGAGSSTSTYVKL